MVRASVGRLGNRNSRLVQLDCLLVLPVGIVSHTLVRPQVLLFQPENLKKMIVYVVDLKLKHDKTVHNTHFWI